MLSGLDLGIKLTTFNCLKEKLAKCIEHEKEIMLRINVETILPSVSKSLSSTPYIWVNPLTPNVFSHPNQLDESISNFRVVGWYFSFLNFKRNVFLQHLQFSDQELLISVKYYFFTAFAGLWPVVAKLSQLLLQVSNQ